MRINTNVMALNAQNMLTKNQSAVERSIQKLSSGLRINGASDDAAGLAISEKMRSQIRGLDQAESNAQDGISLLQTAEGALQQTTDILQRMRELVIKAQNTGVLTEDDKVSINTEMSTLRDEIDRIASSTSFNSKKLLDGSLGTKLDTVNTTVDASVEIDVKDAMTDTDYVITATTGASSTEVTVTWNDADGVAQTETLTVNSTTTATGVIKFDEAGIELNAGEGVAVGNLAGTVATAAASEGERAAFKIGANTYEQDTLYIGIGDMGSTGLSQDGSKLSIDVSTPANANTTLDAMDYAISKVSSQRATLGAVQNRMEYAISNLTATQENLSAAESRIRDVDMASEMVSYTKNSILNQSAMAMLAQANQQPQSILALLQ
jgi:flagellin